MIGIWSSAARKGRKVLLGNTCHGNFYNFRPFLINSTIFRLLIVLKLATWIRSLIWKNNSTHAFKCVTRGNWVTSSKYKQRRDEVFWNSYHSQQEEQLKNWLHYYMYNLNYTHVNQTTLLLFRTGVQNIVWIHYRCQSWEPTISTVNITIETTGKYYSNIFNVQVSFR